MSRRAGENSRAHLLELTPRFRGCGGGGDKVIELRHPLRNPRRAPRRVRVIRVGKVDRTIGGYVPEEAVLDAAVPGAERPRQADRAAVGTRVLQAVLHLEGLPAQPLLYIDGSWVVVVCVGGGITWLSRLISARWCSPKPNTRSEGSDASKAS